MTTNTLVMGAGKMGSALVRALAANGHQVTVWNRTASKAEALADVATQTADQYAAARGASLILVSISNYAACETAIYTDEFAQAAKGGTIVQLTTETPEDARRSARWAKDASISYLDAAILAYPRHIGTEDAAIYYAGDRTAFDRYRDELTAFSNEPVFVSDAVGAASALDCAILEVYYAASLAFLHGAALCESEGIPAGMLFDQKAAFLGLIDATVDTARGMIETNNYTGHDSDLDTHVAALRNIVEVSRDRNVAPHIPDAIHRSYADSAAGGRGDLELPAVYDYIRRRR